MPDDIGRKAQTPAMADSLSRSIPPQNLEAELAVLGGIFLQPDTFSEVSGLLEEDDFYSPAHRIIYRSCVHLASRNQPTDLLMVANELESKGDLDQVGGKVYLAELAQSVVSAANAPHYAEIVRQKAVQRRLIEASTAIIQQSSGTVEDLSQLVDDAQAKIFEATSSKALSTYVSSQDLVRDVFEKMQERFERQELITGVPTGYARFDELTAGLQPTDLIIIAGRPAMGKTAFVLNVAMNAALDGGVPTAIFSLEMGMDQLMMRMLCIHGLVDLKGVRTGFIPDEDWAKLTMAAGALERAPIFIDDTPALSALELRSRCRRLKQRENLGLVVVDYLQLMRASRRTDSREQEISDISRNLKALAKELHVPVVALSQLNRKVEERTNKRPMLSDLRESGAIEQDADVICFIYRDEVYNEDSPKKGMAEIIVGKQRNGPTGMVELAFIARSTAFGDLSHLPEPTPSDVSGG